MKWLSLFIGCLCIIVNIAILLLITHSADIVAIISSCVIAATALSVFASAKLPIKDGFKISLTFLFIFFGMIEYILSFFIQSSNVFFIVIISLFLFQILCLIIINTFSRNE